MKTAWAKTCFSRTPRHATARIALQARAVVPSNSALAASGRARLRRPRADRRQDGRGGARRGDGRAVDQGDDRPERHRGARGVPRLRRRQVDQRPGAADRQRPAAGVMVLNAWVGGPDGAKRNPGFRKVTVSLKLFSRENDRHVQTKLVRP